MRKVLFQKFIPPEFAKAQDSFTSHQISGTGCMSDFIHEGLFHQFIACETYGTDDLYHACAIVETSDGLILEVPLPYLKFVSKQIPPPPPPAHETNL